MLVEEAMIDSNNFTTPFLFTMIVGHGSSQSNDNLSNGNAYGNSSNANSSGGSYRNQDSGFNNYQSKPFYNKNKGKGKF